ncbi:hypothetical protein [Brevundimonas sp.]|uniref:hypothetical protein n=1 Tax=Brevundimonas sp. TaxID=1871086 RepID=UPI0028A2A9DC|nr:hypothetical protein [Brevundimonas sp.]
MFEAMLELDDSRWSELTHAYGAASDIPDLLHALAKRPQQQGANNEPWFTLWSSLFHQGDVYTASYAAIPHVVQIAVSEENPIDFDFLLLPASVDVARVNGRGPEVPDFLIVAYDSAIARLPDCVAAHLGESWNQDMTIAAIAAIAVSKRHHALAEAVMNLDEDWITKINNVDWE